MKIKKILAAFLAVTLLVLSVVPAGLAACGNIDPDIIAETGKTAVQIEGEGLVLLKNEDNCLPLAGKRLNIFGVCSAFPYLGGTGSGCILSENPINFYAALDEQGVEYNTELRELYEANGGKCDIPYTDHNVFNNLLQMLLLKSSPDEMNPSKLTKEIMSNAVSFSDTAMIVIGRTGKEGSDLTQKELSLSEDEKAMVEKVTAAFENVIVLFNTANIMEMGWIEEYDSIKAAMLVWIPGECGFRGVVQALQGEINPSGRLTDTVAYHVEDFPSTENFGSYSYKGLATSSKYVEYQEGIYVGYRYFETFAQDKVQYPFGYGLSYTEFKKEALSFDTENDEVSITVKVTNIGRVSGKDTVQVYYSAPYTAGGIEKSAICLGGFAKTKLLSPGESETVRVSFDAADMASYDYKGREAYVLEKGEYKIILGENAREHISDFTYNVESDRIFKADSVSGAEIKNLFADAYNGFTILSRADAAATYPAARALDVTDEIRHADDLPEPLQGEVPTIGAVYEKTITLQDVSEDENLWDAFLDQLTLDEMTMLVVDGGYETYGIERLGVPHTMDNDGPSSVKGRNGSLFRDCGTAYPCATAIACTWNTALAQQLGEGIGIEAADIGTDIWYAPGVNIHRNPMGGRNFEYFSEDPLLSGIMSGSIIRGAKSEKLVVTIKHFALNEQETNRAGVCTWIDEQALREIYLKAFEIPLKDNDCVGIMSAFNRIGKSWCGGSSALLKDLLRTEWGFDGFVVSDYSTNFYFSGYMSPAVGVYNGNDTILTGIWAIDAPSNIITVKQAYARDPVGFGTALREACKNLCAMKMHTKAYMYPEITYDDTSFSSWMVKAEDWDFESPYTLSFIKLFFTNVFNTITWVFLRVM